MKVCVTNCNGIPHNHLGPGKNIICHEYQWPSNGVGVTRYETQ